MDKITERLKNALRLRRAASGTDGGDARTASFRLRYERFREILSFNDSTLELIADIEELLAGQQKFSLHSIARRVRRAAMDVFLMVKNLNLIAQMRHTALYQVLERLNAELETEIGAVKESGVARFVLPLPDLRAGDVAVAGSKMAHLGEIRGTCGLPVPDGFVITTDAFVRFMAAGNLWDACQRLDASLESTDLQALADACRDVQESIRRTPVAPELAAAIGQAFRQHFPEPGALVAIRSSASAEDSAATSHAGLYLTELNTDEAHLLDAYRAVLASTFSATAVAYRYQRGLTCRDSLMAVGCVRMVQPRAAGIILSRLPEATEVDAVMISATGGIAAGIAAGSEHSETWVVRPGQIADPGGGLLSREELTGLIEGARRLEVHFGAPQDVEWAIDRQGGLLFLQARPMIAVSAREARTGAITGREPLLQGGLSAFPGAASGPVVLVKGEPDLSSFPAGGVLVARHSSPVFARIMDRCSAIVTDVGSPTGHMASLAREFEVPTIVGLDGATRALAAGGHVTVDALACRVYEGVIPMSPPHHPHRSRAESPALERLRRIARLITPLSMTDPAAPEFRPESCRSLHDVTRYVHEKVFESMFHYGDLASADLGSGVKLQARLPIRVEVFDVGQGIAADAPPARIHPEHVTSAPMRAFLEGLLEPRIRWDLPRPVSMRGFLSVLGESIAGPPTESGQLGRISYAIVSDRYMNFSTKAGYHFSTVDTYCGRSVNKNYIHFRFSGGAADAERRGRRIRFLSAVVGALDFKVQARSDLLVARLDKYRAEDIQARLVALGRLTLCARQLDMLMDSDASPEIFARAFLAGEWEKF